MGSQIRVLLIALGVLFLTLSNLNGAKGASVNQSSLSKPSAPVLAHKSKSGSKASAPLRPTHEELHRTGLPKGWKFLIPNGDPDAGEELFIELQCHQCHMVRGENIPPIDRGPQDVGPDLTGMGSHHPPEYFAEAIMNPNRVIVEEKGYAGKDGLSTMPSYSDILTIQELIDLVAYLSSLREEGSHDHAVEGKPPKQRKKHDH